MYYNTTLKMLMQYDSSRTKWLSVAESFIYFGRNGNTADGSYYRVGDGLAFSAVYGRYAEYNGTVVSLVYTRSDNDAATFEVTADGAQIATLASTALAGKTTTLNANFNANAVLGVRNQAGGNTTSEVAGWVRIKWRV
jgi:hypothetical protein